MSHCRFPGTVTIFCFILFFLHLPFSAGQDAPDFPAAENAATEPFEPLTIRLSVDEVRLDVVVVDKKGHPITDLTAADFEIYQNRLPQAVASSVYIKNQADAPAKPAASRKGSPNLPPLPVSELKREDVRRTIVFVVDNLSMEASDLYYAKTSIKRFMETQMQPEDMVAIISASYGASAIDFFSSDKRQITARVDNIPFAIPMFAYPGAFDDPVDLARSTIAAGRMNEDLKARIHGYQISTVSYSIRALKDMPGRKILFFISSMPTIAIHFDENMIMEPSSAMKTEAELMSYNLGNLSGNLSEMYSNQLDRLADEALRAGVVVHTLDARGLGIEEPSAPRGISRTPELNYADGLNGLSKRTGGIFVENSNFFHDGVGKEANNMIAGYYMLSYAPPPSTFNADQRAVYNRVEIKVKRKGAVAYTRDGFYGRARDDAEPAEPAHPLRDAVYSPFKHADLGVNIAAGYIRDAKAGYLVRSWIHLDPKDVTIVETEGGGARIDLETVCMTSDIAGYVHDYKHSKYTFDIKPENKSENLAWIRKHGIRFSLLLPVKKPGLYTVRIAVQDTESGNTGSAWQNLEVHDLDKKGLALSDVFMITSADDLDWTLSGAAEEDAEGVFAPIFQSGEVRSPALRTYMPGDGLYTLAVLYNADAKAPAASNIEIRHVLYKDGVEFQRGEAMPLARESAENHDGILILRKFTIGSNMPPGDYILQLIASDKKNGKKQEGVAAKTLSFTIAAGD